MKEDRDHIHETESESSSFMRAFRLLVDYFKVEYKLRKYGIKHTIVIFGSARTVDYESALENLQITQSAYEEDPSGGNLSEVKKAQKLLKQSYYYEEARKLGSMIGRSGKGPGDCSTTLMSGGGGGVMEAANRGAYEVGAKSIGLNIRLPHEQRPNPYITPELLIEVRYFAIRKLHFVMRTRSFIIFPGGFGTLDELFEIMVLVQTGRHPKIPIVLVGKEFWSKLFDFSILSEEGMIGTHDTKLIRIVESAEEAYEEISRYYRQCGYPLN